MRRMNDANRVLALMGEFALDRDGQCASEVAIVEFAGPHQTVVPLFARGQVGDVMDRRQRTAFHRLATAWR